MESHFLLPLLDKHTDGQTHISQLIADFAGYHFVDSVDQYLRRVPSEPFSRTIWIQWKHPGLSMLQFLLLHILYTGTLLYCSFIPMYTISRHWNNSYALFLRTECMYYDSRNMTIVDVHSLCHPNTLKDAEEYTFSLEWDTLELYGKDSDDMDCYVNTENFKVRSPLHNGACQECFKCCGGADEYCCPELRNRCGRCCSIGADPDEENERERACPNICCIGCCLSGVILLISCWIGCLMRMFCFIDRYRWN